MLETFMILGMNYLNNNYLNQNEKSILKRANTNEESAEDEKKEKKE